MNESEAVVLAGKLFASQGRVASAEIVAEYGEMMLDADCGSCVRATVDYFRRHATGNRVPTVPQLWASYRERYGSVEHGLHLGQDEVTVKVGEVEGFFRGKGAQVVREAVPDASREESVYLSLSAWWAETRPTPWDLEAFLDSAAGWITSTREYFSNRRDPKAQTEKLAAACRKRDTVGIGELTMLELP